MNDDQAMIGPDPRTRRALLAGAGAAGAAVLLAGCGSDDDGGADKDAGGPSPSGGSASATSGTTLAKTSEIPVGSARIFTAEGVVVAQPTAGQFKAFSAICTHQGCPVSRVEGGTIICTCHNSRFSAADGSVQGGPASRPLEPREVTVQGDNVTLA